MSVYGMWFVKATPRLARDAWMATMCHDHRHVARTQLSFHKVIKFKKEKKKDELKNHGADLARRERHISLFPFCSFRFRLALV